MPANDALSDEQKCEPADQLFKAAAQPTEVKESKASEADAFTKELAPIHAGIEGWKASLSKLSFLARSQLVLRSLLLQEMRSTFLW